MSFPAFPPLPPTPVPLVYDTPKPEPPPAPVVIATAPLIIVGTTVGSNVALLLHGLKELSEWMFRRRHGRLHATLRRALLAQVELAHRIVLDGREVHDGIAFVAAVTDHQATTSGSPICTNRASSI